ncbi:glycosyltransferase family 4 protein [Natronoarchaeum rubrum]|uniref:glycosyltransferase family 4 protein n=1 Tax=Natronoarchaeum rubrum TaxID=755311 RepID=UPI002112472A|nr:glycosyltransferase family 4 protein [Natronoarchaeum rubrum]
MRILRVAQKLYPDTKGGGQYHVHAMSRDQAEMGHDVTVLTTRDDKSLPRIEETHGYTVVRVSPGVTIAGNDVSPAVAQYLWGVDTESFDVIHAHSHLYFSTNLAALKRRLGDIPLAITNHGLYSQSAPEWVFDLYLKTLGRWTFNRADVVFCYTETDEQRLRDLGVETRIDVVSNGIDTERFRLKGPESDLIDSTGPVVLFVGRLVDGKRPKAVIEVFDDVLEEFTDAELYLCGSGPLRDELEQDIAELEIAESVTFLGHVPYDEMPAVYRSSDVLVLPSRAEGVPRVVLESLASGLPVVCSPLEQLHDVIAGGGALVDPDDKKAFSISVIDSITGGSSHAEFESTYEWESTVEETTSSLRSLVH